LYDEVALPSNVDCSLLHDSDHPTFIVGQTLQVLLSLSHDTTILLSSTVRDLDKWREGGGNGYCTSTRRERGGEGERVLTVQAFSAVTSLPR
jgi:hypothetical protein